MRRALLLAVLLGALLPGTASAGRWLAPESLGESFRTLPHDRAGGLRVFVADRPDGPLTVHRGDPDLPPRGRGVPVPGSEGAYEAAVAVDRTGRVVVAWQTVKVGEDYHQAWGDGRVFASTWRLGARPPAAPQRLDHEPYLALMEVQAEMAGGTAAVVWTRYSDYGGTETASEGVDIATGRVNGPLRARALARRPGGLVSLDAVRGRPEVAWTVRRRGRATLLRRRIAPGGGWLDRPHREASFDGGALVDYQVSPRGDRLLAHRVFEPGITSDVFARLGAPGRPLGPPRRFRRSYLEWAGGLSPGGTVAVAYPGRRVAPFEHRMRVARGSTAAGWSRTETLAPALSDQPVIALDATGRAFVTWLTRVGRLSERMVAAVAERGRRFGRPVPISAVHEGIYGWEVEVGGRGRATARWMDEHNIVRRARYR